MNLIVPEPAQIHEQEQVPCTRWISPDEGIFSPSPVGVSAKDLGPEWGQFPQQVITYKPGHCEAVQLLPGPTASQGR